MLSGESEVSHTVSRAIDGTAEIVQRSIESGQEARDGTTSKAEVHTAKPQRARVVSTAMRLVACTGMIYRLRVIACGCGIEMRVVRRRGGL